MELAVWTYEGPTHVGAMRIANSMEGIHYVLHAPQGDTYADLLFTMIERNKRRPPVTYSTFQARDLGGDTADLVIRTVTEAYERFKPDALLVGESCTAELIQDQPGGLAATLNLPVPVVPLELPAYSRKENWAASETFYRIVRTLNGTDPSAVPQPEPREGRRPRANLLGPTSLGFRCRDDVTEIERLLDRVGVDVNVVAPLGATPQAIREIPAADFNVCLYPEVARTAARWLEKTFGQPFVKTVPIGVGATLDFLAEVSEVAQLPIDIDSMRADSRFGWYSRSIDSTYFTGKRVAIFGDATHALAAARIARDEFAFEVVGLGTYSREMAKDVRAAARDYGVEPLVTDDYLEVERHIAELEPELVLGTQMERHIAKRLGVPCAVISAPVHVQDFPARYSPQMGFEGANVIFDTWAHPLLMGLEEHLLNMFRDDFEFNDSHAPSHLGESAPRSEPIVRTVPIDAPEAALPHADAQLPPGAPVSPVWDDEAERELKKIPFFVRGKARRNTERFAMDRGLSRVSIETLYDAKAHFGR